jgi:glycosyltransferase involved in cell wall biosynthesis
VHISIQEGGLARLLGRKSRKPFGVDDDRETALSLRRAEVRMLRLDPARGIAGDEWWQNPRDVDAVDLVARAEDATVHQTTGTTINTRLGGQGQDFQLVQQAGGTLQAIGSQRTLSEPDVTGAFTAGGEKERDLMLLSTPAPEAGGRMQRWQLLLLSTLRHFHLFPVRDGEEKGITSLLDRETPPLSARRRLVERNEESTGDVRVPESYCLELPRCSEVMSSDDVSLIESPQEPVAAGNRETPSIVDVTGDRQGNAKQLLGLQAGEPVFLFSGEMSYATGVDILADALITVCQNHQGAQFVFIGNGDLRNDIEARVLTAGFSHRCRFTGAVSPATFDLFLAACDVVVIPARERQSNELAEKAHTFGKPVLATHQAQVCSVIHGYNGLLAYDCANSLVWGLREMIAKPLHLGQQQESVERQAA